MEKNSKKFKDWQKRTMWGVYSLSYLNHKKIVPFEKFVKNYLHYL